MRGTSQTADHDTGLLGGALILDRSSLLEGPAKDTWENEGGALRAVLTFSWAPLQGTEVQVEWAKTLREKVNAEFDRVEVSLRMNAARQGPGKQQAIAQILAILEDQRKLVLARDQAGYFIHDWQEITDQVRRMILRDKRYEPLRTAVVRST